MSADTLIFIPTYNERDNVERLCSEILSLAPEAGLLFLDDNSPDGTGEVLDRLARADRRVRVIHRPGKQGIGSAHREGIAWAYQEGYSRLVTMDCDFTHSPSDVANVMASAGDFAVTVGSRFLRRDSLAGWGRFRVLLTHGGHAVTRTLLRLPFDASGALRVYHLPAIPREAFSLVRATGYGFFFESLFILAQNGVSIQEVPIVLPSRTAGRSKMNLREIVRGVSYLFFICGLNLLHPARFKLAPGSWTAPAGAPAPELQGRELSG